MDTSLIEIIRKIKNKTEKINISEEKAKSDWAPLLKLLISIVKAIIYAVVVVLWCVYYLYVKIAKKDENIDNNTTNMEKNDINIDEPKENNSPSTKSIQKNNVAFYNQWWFWVVIAFVFVYLMLSNSRGSNNNTLTTTKPLVSTTITSTTTKVTTSTQTTSSTKVTTSTQTTSSTKATTTTNKNVPTYEGNNLLTIDIKCDENLIFSRYDINVLLDGSYIGTISHGSSNTFDLKVSLGSHNIRFENVTDDSVFGEYHISVENDKSILLQTHCYYGNISVDLLLIVPKGDSYYEGKNYTEVEQEFIKLGFSKIKLQKFTTDDESKNGKVRTIEINWWGFDANDKFSADSEVDIEYYEYKKTTSSTTSSSSVYYSTNDYETACKGNTGVFAYKSSKNYDVYWIIDFDEGYVYNFTSGNGDDTCDRVKIYSGTLNDSMRIIYHIDGESTSWYLHFNYVNSPSKLIVNDHLGLAHEFTPTNLNSAIKIRNTKIVIDR